MYAVEEIRQIVFAINLIEDIRQDAAVTWGADLPKAGKIFEVMPDVHTVAEYLRQAPGAH